jgi:hypothetical protein
MIVPVMKKFSFAPFSRISCFSSCPGFDLCISEGQRLRGELLCQTEAKGRSLADALEVSAKNAVLCNILVEEQISQRLLDNARLVDQLLMSGAVDQELLKKVSVMNHLQKVELLANRGQRWEPPLPSKIPMEMREHLHAPLGDEVFPPHPPFNPFVWGRHCHRHTKTSNA